MTSNDHDHRVERADHVQGGVALVGASCARLEWIARELARHLAPFRVVYIDETHDESVTAEQLSHWTRRGEGYSFTTPADAPLLPVGYDVTLVNGQHFSGDKYIVVAEASKEQSVRKRSVTILSVQAILLPEGVTDVPEYIRGLPSFHPDIPVFRESQLSECAALIRPAVPPLNALVLAGGKSVRMGQDKCRLHWHGQEQWEWLMHQTSALGMPTYLSSRSKSDFAIDQIIEDTFLGMGPLGGIFSAFRYSPHTAWLVLACDMPLVSREHLALLVRERDTTAYATAFFNEEKQWFEPLFAIFEPRAFPAGMLRLAHGKTCPRKWLNGLPYVKRVAVPDPSILVNVNTPEERLRVLEHHKHDLE